MTLNKCGFLFREYLDRTAEEINEALQDVGQLSIGELSKTFNLSSEFLLSVSSKEKIIFASIYLLYF